MEEKILSTLTGTASVLFFFTLLVWVYLARILKILQRISNSVDRDRECRSQEVIKKD